MIDKGYCLEMQKAAMEKDILKMREQFKDSINLLRIEFEERIDRLTEDLGDLIMAIGINDNK